MRDLYGNYIIESIHEATELLKEVLESRGLIVLRISEENHGRDRLFKVKHPIYHVPTGVLITPKIEYYYLKYQRRYFMEFPKVYEVVDPRDVCEAVGINLSILKRLAKNRVDYIVFCNALGRLLYVKTRTYLRLVEEYVWYRRSQRTGEFIANLPLSRLKELKKPKISEVNK